MGETLSEWEIITKNLKAEINTSVKTKAQIAKELGVSSATLAQYQSGRAFPSLVTLKRLCKVLDCTYTDILD